jgi:site-specific DNA-methyltransferase (adenine-specific)
MTDGFISRSLVPSLSSPEYEIYSGDCRDVLSTFQDGSINCCVTSPPYWGLRDYGADSQIGLEDDPKKFVDELVSVFREVHRVLRDDGVLWLNLGDSYAGNNSRASNNGRAGFGAPREGVFSRTGEGLKPKDLVGIPWMVALALRDDGWYLRQDIIWHKPNPLPESVKDRCTKSHEYLFLLTKSPSYYFDYQAIREPAVGSTDDGLKNKRSVWSVPVRPYKGSHFATFPTELIRPCILAGSPPGGVVLDPFGGSGTTVAVSLEERRTGVAIELNQEYLPLIQKRIDETIEARDSETEQLQLFLET